MYQHIPIVGDESPWLLSEPQGNVIVLGPRGMTGWKRVMLGSVFNAVAAKAPCRGSSSTVFCTWNRRVQTTRSQATL